MNFQITLALRYLQGRKQRTLLTTLAITIGVMLIFGLNGMIPALMGMMRQNLMASADHADLTITNQARGAFNAEVVSQVSGVEGVAAAAGSLARSMVLSGELALPVRDGAKIDTVIITGVETQNAGEVGLRVMVVGRDLQPGDADALVISENLSRRTGLEVGSKLRLPTAEGVRSFDVVGVTAEAPSLSAEPVYMPLAAVQRLFNLDGQINTIDVVLQAGANRQQVSQAVLASLGAGYKVGQNEAGSELVTAITAGQFIFNVFGLLALVMGGFIIFNTFRTIVVERRRDIGMLRAIGATRRMVLNLVLVESFLQGLVGTLLGLLGGFAMIKALLWALQPTVKSLMQLELGEPVFSLQTILTAVGMGVGVTMLSGLFPALAASRLSPLEAMRPTIREPSREAAAWRLAGSGLLAACGVFGLLSGNPLQAAIGMLIFVVALIAAAPVLVFPISQVFGRLLEMAFMREGMMAQGNLVRQPVRSAVTVSAVMIGLAVLLGVTSFVTSVRAGAVGYLEHSFSSDYLIMPQSIVLGGGNIGAKPDFIEHIRQIPGVDAATSLRVSTARSGSSDIQVIGIDPPAFEQISGLDFSQGDPDPAYTQLAGGRWLITNSILAGQLQVKPGDEVELQTADGPKTYRVAAIANDIITAKLASAYLSQDNLAGDFHETTDLLIMVKRKPGADGAALVKSLESTAAAYPAFVLYDTRQWRAGFNSEITRAMDGFTLLLLLLAIPSLLALMNTLGINVLERTREIGMLRAVGATRRQIGRLILAESLLLAAIGSAFGILIGLWFGQVLVLTLQANGFQLTYFFPLGGLLMTAAGGLLLGAVAAWLPARAAAHLDVVEALRYE